MLSHLRRAHHQEFERNSMPARSIVTQFEQWKTSDHNNSSFFSTQLPPDVYPTRSSSTAYNTDLSRALRFDAYLLAIVRVEDKRNAFYSAEVVSKLRQKEQTQSFINKPCSLFVTDRSLVVFDRATQTIAESIPLENVDPTCVHADVPDKLNDIFMYRLLDRQLTSLTSHASSTNSNEASSVVVFKCANNEAKLLVDSIRTATGKPLKHSKSSGTLERRVTESYDHDLAIGTGLMQKMSIQSNQNNNQAYLMNNQQSKVITQQTVTDATDYYKRLTEELNKCFDDIELFVRYLEALTEYAKELERDHRRKDKRSPMGLKNMIDKLPDDRYFVDVLQKFKHSFNLLGELKHIIHNPNAPELIHYLLSPLQFILYVLRTKHTHQLQLAQEVWIPTLTREAKDLLLNCLTSKEHEMLKNLGPAWSRTADESSLKFSDYRPVFFDGRSIWIQEPSFEQLPTRALPSITTTQQFDERPVQQQTIWTSTTRQTLDNRNSLPATSNQTTTYTRQFETDRSVKNGIPDNFNTQMQNEHAWAIDRKRAGAKICAVKIDRKGQNAKELTVRRGELIEIEDNSKKWWRARNFQGDVGHVPNNIVEEIEIEHRPLKISPSAVISHRALTTMDSRSRYN